MLLYLKIRGDVNFYDQVGDFTSTVYYSIKSNLLLLTTHHYVNPIYSDSITN
jgi:hypothetical protein